MTASREAGASFACFGSTCSVLVTGDVEGRSAATAVEHARARMLRWHAQFTRFEPASELSALNADPRVEIPVSPDMATVVAAAIDAARQTGGLVDPTLVTEIERAGYDADLRTSLPLATALSLAPPRFPARASQVALWTRVTVDRRRGIVRRPPGTRLDPGGIAKGVFADVLAQELSAHAAFAVDCAGDVRVGGADGTRRTINVASPFGNRVLHAFALADVGVATSGIGRRSWRDGEGRPAHHLLDPATGRPAYTGVVQATALASTAARAEALAKAAVLAGPDGAAAWLPHGGVIAFDDGSREILEPRMERLVSSAALRRLTAPALRA